MAVGSSMHKKLMASLGVRIVEGKLPAGSVLRSVDLAAAYGVSLTVVRESLRALEVMGLVRVKPSLGIVVQESLDWSYLDTHIIDWRFAAESRDAQVRSLREMRAAILPAAAASAAERATGEQSAQLIDIAEGMNQRDARMRVRFVDQEVAFCAILLAASGNEMFGSLQTPLARSLILERQVEPMSPKEHETLRSTYSRLAESIATQRPEDARHIATTLFSSILVERT